MGGYLSSRSQQEPEIDHQVRVDYSSSSASADGDDGGDGLVATTVDLVASGGGDGTAELGPSTTKAENRSTKDENGNRRKGRISEAERPLELPPMTPVVSESFKAYLVAITKPIVKDHDVPQEVDEEPTDEVAADEEAENEHGACVRRKSDATVARKSKTVNMIDHSMATVDDEMYSAGDGVLLNPNHVKFAFNRQITAEEKDEDPKYDEGKFPEKHRKYDKNGKLKGGKISHCTSFVVGRIIAFTKVGTRSTRKPSGIQNGDGEVLATVRLFYHPEDTCLSDEEVLAMDKNLLYISEEIQTLNVIQFEDRCVIFPRSEVDARFKSLDKYSDSMKTRFFYNQLFNGETAKFECLPVESFDDEKCSMERFDSLLNWSAKPEIRKPLHALDLFNGCGGLSRGFHESGVSVTKWAVENDQFAAATFKDNFPLATVYTECINVLLKEVVNDPTKARLPNPASNQVDMIIGGPPCQGFSSLNRCQSGENAKKKNLCLISFFTAVELYKPKYVVMENVRGLLTHTTDDQSLYGMALNCLTKLGYDVSKQLMQAGNYGVPQTRRRIFVMATRDNLVRPTFPKPVHSFGTMAGPFRPLTVQDAISDLVDAPTDKDVNMHPSKPMSQYQRELRKSSGDNLFNHVLRRLTPVNQERINRIPKSQGADWRDLPNVAIDDASIDLMKYYTNNQGETSVCKNCFGGVRVSASPCKSQGRHTLIPWGLAHTADKNDWPDCYGRLHFSESFPTVDTSIQPMKRQGRVIHPVLDRMITVREVARGQGFPDNFKFIGKTKDQLQQVGNAVPPPLAFHLGRAILLAVFEEEKRGQ